MKQTLKTQAKRVGIALAAAAAFTALGTATAQAAQFDSASIALDNAGNLQCKWRETGLGALALITYDCSAEGVAVVTGCFVKNKFVGPFSVSIFKNVTGEESTPLLAKNNGAISGTITVEVPEGHGGAQCDEAVGAEPQNVAVRWCNASLTDVTNGIVGASTGQLTDILLRTGTQVAPIPTCTEILAAPGDGGEG
jgi:hypothetical protein